MSVYITFEPHNESGVIAEGTLLSDAARRVGVPISTDCRGLGECDACAFIVRDGAGLLSPPTEAEYEQLSSDRLSAGERLLCQTRVERSGELVLMSPPDRKREQTVKETVDNFRKEFRALPLGSKIKRLAEFEAVSAFEALTTIANLPFTVGDKVLDAIVDFSRKKSHEQKTQHQDEQSPDTDTDEKPVE